MDFLGPLASNGLLGLLLAYTLWDNRQLRKENQELNEKRVGDAQETIKGVIEPLGAFKTAFDEQKTMFSIVPHIWGVSSSTCSEVDVFLHITTFGKCLSRW